MTRPGQTEQLSRPSAEQRVTSWVTVLLYIVAASLIIETTAFRLHPVALYVVGFALARLFKFTYRELFLYTVVTSALLFFVPASYSVRYEEAPIYGVALLILCYVSGESYRTTDQLTALKHAITKEHSDDA